MKHLDYKIELQILAALFLINNMLALSIKHFLACFLTIVVAISFINSHAIAETARQGSNGYNKTMMKDPLKIQERQKILNSIRNRNPSFKASLNDSLSNRRSGSSVLVPNEPVLLLLEKRPADNKNSGARLANAYYYDYQKDQTIHCIVDAESGAIHNQLNVRDMQLPLVDEEIQRTFDIFMQSKHRRKLAKSYYQATGQSLIDLSNIDFKAYVFHSSISEDQLKPKTRQCGKTRCAQLLLYTNENIALDLNPIISLSKAKVLQVNTVPSQHVLPDNHHDSADQAHH